MKFKGQHRLNAFINNINLTNILAMLYKTEKKKKKIEMNADKGQIQNV